MARAWAAVLWQEIIDGSREPTRSAGIPVEADIGILFFFSFSDPSNSMPGVNERLTIRNLGRVCFEQLLIGRCDVRHGSWGVATWPGGGGARKGQYRGNHTSEDIVIFPSQWAGIKR